MLKWNSTIGTSLGRRVPYKSLRFGIEIECEAMFDEYPEMNYWTCVRDPSLRNGGIEFVSDPTLPQELAYALEEVEERIEMYDLEATERCGVHVHMNVSYWTWETLFKFATTYALMEPYLFGQHAEGRENNHFCVPLWANAALSTGLANDCVRLRAGTFADALELLQCCKYSAINFAPISRLGTVEFRQMGGTIDMEKIHKWCDALHRVADWAAKQESPEAIVQYYEDYGPERMAEALEIHTCEVHPDVTDDCYETACMMCGYDPVRWQELDWEIPEVEIAREVHRERDFDPAPHAEFLQDVRLDLDMRERIMEILEGDE